MITVLLFWIYLSLLLYLYGWAFIRMLERMSGFAHETISFTMIWLSGLCVVVSIAGVFSLFMKLGLLVNILLLAGGLMIAWSGLHSGQLQASVRTIGEGFSIFKGKKKLPYVALLVLGIIVLWNVLLLSLGSPANPDSGIYHAQTIRWIETYRAVPGLGNIHTRLAYNSSWMLANALFSFSFSGNRSLHLMGSSLFMITALYALGGLLRMLRESHMIFRLSNLARVCLLPFLFIVLGSEVSSPGSDMPAALLAWIVVIELLAVFEKGQTSKSLLSILLVMVAALAATIKLSHAPLLLLAAYPLLRWLRERKFREIVVLFTLGGLVMLPWLARNVILSGYLVYPFPAIDIFQVDWKIPVDIARQDKDTIMSWTKPWLEGQDVEDVLQMPLRQWAPIWFDRLTIHRKGMVSAVLLLPAAAVLLSFCGSRFSLIKDYFKKNWFVYVFLYACLVFWFLNGPAFRFGYGFIIPAMILGGLPLALPVLDILKEHRQGVVILIALFLIGFQSMFSTRIFNMQIVQENILQPADYPVLPTRPCELKNMTVWCAEAWEACWYEPFPCIPNADSYAGLRGESIEDGFRHD